MNQIDSTCSLCLTVVPLNLGEIYIYKNYAAKLRNVFKTIYWLITFLREKGHRKSYGELEGISRKKNTVLLTVCRLQKFVSDILKTWFLYKSHICSDIETYCLLWIWIMCYEMNNKEEAWVKMQKWSSKDNKPIKSTRRCRVVWSSFWGSCNQVRYVLFSLNLKKVTMDSFHDAVSNKAWI